MGEIEKIRDGLYIKKSWDGYRIVYPIKKDITKSFGITNISWKNFLIGGSWWFAIKVMLFGLLLLGSLQAYKHDTAVCREYVANFTEKCREFYTPASNSPTFDMPQFNISNLNQVVNTTYEPPPT